MCVQEQNENGDCFAHPSSGAGSEIDNERDITQSSLLLYVARTIALTGAFVPLYPPLRLREEVFTLPNLVDIKSALCRQRWDEGFEGHEAGDCICP